MKVSFVIWSLFAVILCTELSWTGPSCHGGQFTLPSACLQLSLQWGPHTAWLANALVRPLSSQYVAGPGAEKAGEFQRVGTRGMLGLGQVIDVPCASEQGIKWEKMWEPGRMMLSASPNKDEKVRSIKGQAKLMNMGRQTWYMSLYHLSFQHPHSPHEVGMRTGTGYLAIGNGKGESTPLIGSNSGPTELRNCQGLLSSVKG